MAIERDYYEILGLSRDVDEATIKKAYRRLAMKYHPDRNPDNPKAEAEFKQVKEAYEILSNEQKRAAYDRFGHAGVNQAHAAGSGGGPSGFGGASFNDIFGNVFEDIFGVGAGGRGRQARAAAQQGADLQYVMDIGLEQAVFGTDVEISVPSKKVCDRCDGSGGKDGAKPVDCSTCQGVGQVRMQQGPFTVQQTCPACRGMGKTIREPCNYCSGEGRIRTHDKLSVKIPAGIDDGDRIRLSGKGEAGLYGGPAGDLYIQVKLKPHSIFKRSEQDLQCEIPISFVSASLGGEIEVPTLDGRVKLKIPPETQSGRLFRLRGKGVPVLRGRGKGDLLCKVVVETPINLNKQQKELLKQFGESLSAGGSKHSPKARSWFDGVKRFFEENFR